MGWGCGKDRKGGERRRKVVWPPGQGIGFAVACALAVDDSVVVGSQSRGPPGMSSRGSPGCRKIFEVLMVRVDLDRMLSSFHVDPPLLKTRNHRQELLVVDGVVELGCREFAGVKTNWVQLPIR